MGASESVGVRYIVSLYTSLRMLWFFYLTSQDYVLYNGHIGKNINMIKINKTKEFSVWFESLTIKEQLKIEARLEKIHNLEHFGDAKSLGNGLAELRWANGWRVYFTKDRDAIVLLLSGGNKNAQKKDIQKARILIQKYARN